MGSCAPSSSKACREKQRRERLNDKYDYVALFVLCLVSPFTLTSIDCFCMLFRFMELGVLLEPGRPPKTDKAAILVDAVRMVTQLRDEAQKLKCSNLDLQEKIKDLKARLTYLYIFVCFMSEVIPIRSKASS